MSSKRADRAVATAVLKILLVEDDPQFVYLMQRYAVSSGCQLVHADPPGSTLQIAHREHPDLILFDMVQSASESSAVLVALRADEATRSIPLYLCSASEAVLHQWKQQADGCLLKPVMYEDFMAVLAQVSARKKEV